MSLRSTLLDMVLGRLGRQSATEADRTIGASTLRQAVASQAEQQLPDIGVLAAQTEAPSLRSAIAQRVQQRPDGGQSLSRPGSAALAPRDVIRQTFQAISTPEGRRIHADNLVPEIKDAPPDPETGVRGAQTRTYRFNTSGGEMWVNVNRMGGAEGAGQPASIRWGFTNRDAPNRNLAEALGNVAVAIQRDMDLFGEPAYEMFGASAPHRRVYQQLMESGAFDTGPYRARINSGAQLTERAQAAKEMLMGRRPTGEHTFRNMDEAWQWVRQGSDERTPFLELRRTDAFNPLSSRARPMLGSEGARLSLESARARQIAGPQSAHNVGSDAASTRINLQRVEETPHSAGSDGGWSNETLWHGSHEVKGPIQQFSFENIGRTGAGTGERAIWLSPSETMANAYGPAHGYQVRGRLLDYDANGASYKNFDGQMRPTIATILEEARSQGYDGVRFRRLWDPHQYSGNPAHDPLDAHRFADQIAIFDPANVRPRNLNSTGPSRETLAALLAGGAGGGLTLRELLAQQYGLQQ